ncbi:MAG: glycosyltransferase, partial [Sterolibacterium sp.]
MQLDPGTAPPIPDTAVRVSVIIPLYNHEKYIDAALDSIFAQRVRPDEIIVIDDGSVDASAAKLRRICQEHPEIIFWSWPNQGAHHTLNAAILRATGDFVAILNSDDSYHPGRLAACLAAVKADPSIDVVATAMTFIDDQGHEVANPWYDSALGFFKQEGNLSLGLFNANFLVTTSNLFIRRSVFDTIGYFSPLRYAHDLELCLRLILGRRHIHFLDRPLLSYRLHQTNTIAENKAREDVERAAVFAFFLFRLERQEGLSETWHAWLERYITVLEQQELLKLVE